MNTRQYEDFIKVQLLEEYTESQIQANDYMIKLVIEKTRKFLILCDVGSSLITKKTPIAEWSEYAKLPTKIKNVFRNKEIDYLEDMTFEIMMSQAYLGNSHWSIFIALRGY